MEAMNQKNEFRWADVEPWCVLRMVLRNCWMLVLAALIAGMGVKLALDWIWTPEYTSTITYAVLSKSASANSRANYNAANEVAVKYSSMLESNLMRERICLALGVAKLPGTITAQVEGETNLLQVSATSASPRMAFEMVRAVDAHYPELGQYIDQNAVLHVMTNAQAPTWPSNPVNVRKTVILAAILAGGAMLAALVWFSVARDTIQTQSGARHKLDAEVLAVVPHEKRARGRWGKKDKLLLTSPMVSFFFQEAFFRLRTAAEQTAELGATQQCQVLLVTSVTAGEGKSTVASNLALALAKKHRAVMLIDADLRNPTQIRILGRKAMGKQGLERLLQEESLDEYRVMEAAAYDEATNLVTIISEEPCRNAGKLLSSRMGRLMSVLRKTMDYIIVDSPPIGMFADGDVLADVADSVLLVVRQDVVSACDINDAADAISQGRAAFLGCVLNNMQTGFRFGRTTAYGYGYGYGGYGSEQRGSRNESRSR